MYIVCKCTGHVCLSALHHFTFRARGSCIVWVRTELDMCESDTRSHGTERREARERSGGKAREESGRDLHRKEQRLHVLCMWTLSSLGTTSSSFRFLPHPLLAIMWSHNDRSAVALPVLMLLRWYMLSRLFAVTVRLAQAAWQCKR